MVANVNSPVKAVPLLLTALRLALACWLDIYMLNRFGALSVPVILSLLVFLTDLSDGWLARRLRSPSRLGAALDVSADFFYITSFGVILCWRQVLPLWFMLAVVVNFLGFILTSKVLKEQTSGDHPLVFDRIGRLTAALFYIFPITAYAACILSQTVYRIINPWLLLFCVLLAAISFLGRIARCIKKKPG